MEKLGITYHVLILLNQSERGLRNAQDAFKD